MVTRLQGGALRSSDYEHSRHARVQLQHFQFYVGKAEAKPEIRVSWLQDQSDVAAGCSPVLQDCSVLLAGMYEICGVHQAFCTVFARHNILLFDAGSAKVQTGRGCQLQPDTDRLAGSRFSVMYDNMNIRLWILMLLIQFRGYKALNVSFLSVVKWLDASKCRYRFYKSRSLISIIEYKSIS